MLEGMGCSKALLQEMERHIEMARTTLTRRERIDRLEKGHYAIVVREYDRRVDDLYEDYVNAVRDCERELMERYTQEAAEREASYTWTEDEP